MKLSDAPALLPVASGIYRIVHRESGKSYVGLTKNLRGRVWGHMKTAATGKHRAPIHNAIRKHGISAFDVEIIEQCDAALLAVREVHWIATLGTVSPRGYNLSIGGDRGAMNHPEVREKITGDNHYARRDPEKRKKLVEAVSFHAKMRMANPENRAKLAAMIKERCKDPEVKARMIAAATAALNRPEVRAKLRANNAASRPEVRSMKRGNKNAMARREVRMNHATALGAAVRVNGMLCPSARQACIELGLPHQRIGATDKRAKYRCNGELNRAIERLKKTGAATYCGQLFTLESRRKQPADRSDAASAWLHLDRNAP